MKKDYSLSLISLLKGIVYDSNQEVWENLLKYENDIKKYFEDISLDLYIDKPEGYAFLRQRIEEETEEGISIPRIIEKRQLSFNVSLLCLLLRNYLIENDSQGGASRAILSREYIVNMMAPFMKETSNEVKQTKEIDTAINKITDEGFLRKLKTEEELYEINRIIKAFINADVVQESLLKLKQYISSKED